MILSRRLEGAGCRVTAVGDGGRALELLHGTEYDLVLLDRYMPGMDGLATLEAIRSDAALKDLPVVMLTAESSPESVRLCLARGATDYLTKPVDAGTLAQCLSRLGLIQPSAPIDGAGPVPAAGPSGDALIDWPALRERFGDREDFIRKLAAAVLANHGETPARLRAAAALGDMQTLAFLAHTLKGVGGNMAARRVHELGAQAEASARQGRPDTAEWAGRLADAVQALLDALKDSLQDASA